MTIHREGRATLFYLFIVLLALNILLIYMIPDWASYLLMGASVVFYIFILQFFRSPARQVPAGDDLILSPADGRVVVIEKVNEPEYFNDERIQVSIFMSPLDVHLNRVPVDGKLVYYRYHPGKYVVAFNPKSSELNERNTMVIEHDRMGPFLFRQIAGAVARRIRFFHHENDRLKKGEELGFIKFGSRMDIFLPLDADIRVSIGDHVLATESIISTCKVRG